MGHEMRSGCVNSVHFLNTSSKCTLHRLDTRLSILQDNDTMDNGGRHKCEEYAKSQS